MATHTGAWGSKLGPRVAMLVSQAIVYTHARLVHVKHKLAMMVFHAISDEISEEVDVTLGPLLQKLHDAVTPDHPAYGSIHFMHTVSGQLKALAGTGLQISGLLGTVSTVMNNELADVVYGFVRSNPHLLPDPQTILQMYAASLISAPEAQDAIGAQGINRGWSQNMLTLAYSWPTVADGLEMLRRKLITTDQFSEWCAFNGIPEFIAGIYLKMLDNPVSPADAALATLRGSLTQAEASAIAAENGLTPESFQILIDNTGEPPGLMQLLEAYRRGFIDKATLEKGILESRYRNEWIPMLEQLRYVPMSTADAVNATVQDQLDPNTARSIADQNGLTPGAFDILLNTAGDPLSPTECEQLYNRGLMSLSQYEQALRESRLKNKYIALSTNLHQKILPIFTVQTALRYGGMDQAHAVATIMENGYSKADATEIVNAAGQELLKTYRDQVVSAVNSLYENNMIAAETSSSIISQMGFTQAQAEFITQTGELRREAHVTVTAINAIRGKYLQHHITTNEASGYLDSFQVPAQQRDQLLALWEIEASAFTKTLTEAQTVKAINLNLITPAEGLDRLIAMGYNTTDANLLIKGA